MGKKSKSRPKSLPAHKVAVSSQTLPALEVPATVRNIQTAATITVATQLSNHRFEVLLREARESGCQEGLAVGVSERRVLQEKLEELQGEVRRLEKELQDEKERKELREGEEKEGEITRNDGPPFDWATDVDTTGPAHTQRDTSALHSGARNPWGSLNRRHRRSHPRNPRPPLHVSYRSYQHDHAHTYPVSYPSLPLIHARETVCHPHGIGPIKPIIGVHIPIHVATPARSAAAAESCHGGAIPAHTHITDSHLEDITPPSTFISDITSFSSSLSSHLFSGLRFFR